MELTLSGRTRRPGRRQGRSIHRRKPAVKSPANPPAAWPASQHADFTQELLRKLLPTRAKERQSDSRRTAHFRGFVCGALALALF